jgi:Holliday junction DNA helicase RuvA
LYEYFRGTVADKSPVHVVLDVNGVGYRLEIPASTYERVREAETQGGPVKLLAYFHVREDQHKLYGFATEGERRLFEQLLECKGVGPTIALNILSGSSIPDIVRAIKGGDVSFLDRIKGVGKKTAERVVLELREKADAILSVLARVPLAGGAAPTPAVADDASRALISLGFTPVVARKAVDAALAALGGNGGGGAMPGVEKLVKEALRHTA